MQWISFKPALEEAQAEAFSNALMAAGALSASIEDADAGTPEETTRFAEPRVADPLDVQDRLLAERLPAWRRNRVLVLADDTSDIAALVAQAAQEAGIAVPAYALEPVEDLDWVRNVQAQFDPIQVGRRLWIVPSWHQPPAVPDSIVLRIDPGRAFGTGSHPSTRLVLAWLEAALGGRPNARPLGETALRVLDYGCGSGILSIAAALLGAREVDAVDVDPQALDTALENARSNRARVRIGPPDSLPEGDYDIVVANILSQPLIVLAPLLIQRVRRGGCLALSGILEAHAGEVIAAYAHGIPLRVASRDDGWVLLDGMKPAVIPPV